MSVEAITWALSLKVDRSSEKFVLVAMANCANSDMECWPSVQYLSDATCQDRKTVLENIKRLIADGFISDTGSRKGTTGQVPVYRINSTENGIVKEEKTVPKTEPLETSNSTENGTVIGGNSTVFPMKQSRFSVETVPKTGHGTVSEPSTEPKSTSRAPRTSRGSALPENFYPNETGIGYAEDRNVSLAVELESFRNWHTAKGTTFKDWQAAWRTWCDKAVSYGRAGNSNNRSPPRMSHSDASKLSAARTIFGTEIEGDSDATGRIIDITPTVAGAMGCQNLPRIAGQLRD